ncbi:hypothetical protein [Candidatus Poriferisodalis sp.]|uniref:hypothetical protein n=1 Tax=Candidatus Poriferisodalis sp. TaxID=3101277 RepID=UPI003B021F83
MKRTRHDASGVVGAEVLPFVVLVFIGGTLVFAQAWAALDAKIAAVAGAREAARTFVEHRGPRFGDAADASVAAGMQAMSGHRLSGEASVRPVGTTRLRRCERVTFEAAREVPRLALLGSRWSPVTVGARASEIVDPFRHGLRGRAPCAQ